MPFRVEESRPQRCVVCGRLTTRPIAYKTCCMNRPVYFCSLSCAQKWIRTWMKNQDQVMRGVRGSARLSRLGLL